MKDASVEREHARPLISVVAPFYNEELVIDEFFPAVIDVLQATGMAWEIVCVDDGSRDSSLERLLGRGQDQPSGEGARVVA